MPLVRAQRIGILEQTGNEAFWDDVVLLCNFDGTNGGTDAVDEGPFGLALTYGDNAQLSNVQTFNGSYTTSLLLDGTNDKVSILTPSDYANLQLGSVPFTAEVRLRFDNTGVDWICGFFNESWDFKIQSSAKPTWTDKRGGVSYQARVATLLAQPINTWLEIAVTFDGTDTYTAYLNGVVNNTQGPDAGSIPNGSATAFTIGTTDTDAQDYNGYIQAIRITKADRYGGVGYTQNLGKWSNVG